MIILFFRGNNFPHIELLVYPNCNMISNFFFRVSKIQFKSYKNLPTFQIFFPVDDVEGGGGSST